MRPTRLCVQHSERGAGRRGRLYMLLLVMLCLAHKIPDRLPAAGGRA